MLALFISIVQRLSAALARIRGITVIRDMLNSDPESHGSFVNLLPVNPATGNVGAIG
jgi:hypothetical protein